VLLLETSAGGIQGHDFGGGEAQISCGNQVGKLLDAVGADDRRGDDRLGKEPGRATAASVV